MNTTLLSDTAKKMASRAILAADESSGTIKKRFDTISLKSSPESNRLYRQLLFTSQGIEDYISGVILYDETIRQKSDNDTPFAKILTDKGIVPGIKVDKGTHDIPESIPDTYTQGFDGLSERLKEYRELGAGFAKWRSVLTIDETHPSEMAIERNASDLALYALLCQEADIVPIVEPEVLMTGSHSFERNAEITIQILTTLFKQLKKYCVHIPGTILKPNMVTAGSDHADQKSIEEVAQKTLNILAETVPKDLPGIAFLSGGQSAELATNHLDSINKLRNEDEESYPWRITASFGRALQSETLAAWKGKDENVETAKTAFLTRAEKVFKASIGTL